MLPAGPAPNSCGYSYYYIYIYTPWIGFESELVNHKAERLVGEELKNAYAKSDFET